MRDHGHVLKVVRKNSSQFKELIDEPYSINKSTNQLIYVFLKKNMIIFSILQIF